MQRNTNVVVLAWNDPVWWKELGGSNTDIVDRRWLIVAVTQNVVMSNIVVPLSERDDAIRPGDPEPSKLVWWKQICDLDWLL